MNLEIWTDGSCWKSIGAYAYVLVVTHNGHDHIITGSGSVIDTTSNRCEMLGVICALERLKEGSFNPKIVSIHSDSQYAINMLSGKYSVKPETKNIDLIQQFQRIEIILQKRSISLKWIWVRGHQGTKYNEMADGLAGSEREKLWSSLKEKQK